MLTYLGGIRRMSSHLFLDRDILSLHIYDHIDSYGSKVKSMISLCLKMVRNIIQRKMCSSFVKYKDVCGAYRLLPA